MSEMFRVIIILLVVGCATVNSADVQCPRGCYYNQALEHCALMRGEIFAFNKSFDLSEWAIANFSGVQCYNERRCLSFLGTLTTIFANSTYQGIANTSPAALYLFKESFNPFRWIVEHSFYPCAGFDQCLYFYHVVALRYRHHPIGTRLSSSNCTE